MRSIHRHTESVGKDETIGELKRNGGDATEELVGHVARETPRTLGPSWGQSVGPRANVWGLGAAECEVGRGPKTSCTL